MIVYCSEDNGAFYPADQVDVDEATGQARGYLKYELPESFTLTAEQCFRGYGQISEILLRANILKKT